MLESQSCVVEYKCANNFLKMHLVHRNQKVVYDERENPQHSRKKTIWAEWGTKTLNRIWRRVQNRAQGPVSVKSRKIFGPEKPFLKLLLAYSWKLALSYVVKGIKIKITAKFLASERLRFEDTKRIMSPENGPKATFDGESSHHLTKVWAREMFTFAEIKGRAVLIYCAFICTFLWEKIFSTIWLSQPYEHLCIILLGLEAE